MSEGKVTRESILNAADNPVFSNVMVERWGGAVRVYSMTSGSQEAFDQESVRRKKRKIDIRVRERMIIATVRNDEGLPLFTAADEEALSRQSSAVLDRVFKIACKLNGYGDDEDDAGN